MAADIDHHPSLQFGAGNPLIVGELVWQLVVDLHGSTTPFESDEFDFFSNQCQ